MFVLNASVLNYSILESKLFTFKYPKRKPLSLNTFHTSLWDGIEGSFSSSKKDAVSLLLPVQKETLWKGKFFDLVQSLHILLSKNPALLHFNVPLRLDLVQQKLLLFNVLLHTKEVSEVGTGFNWMWSDSNSAEFLISIFDEV